VRLSRKVLNGKEAAIERQDVWNIQAKDSGLKAWFHGYEGERTYSYIDPYSAIVKSTPYSATGFAVYLTKGQGDNDFQVKRIDFRNGGEPEVLGSLMQTRGEIRFQSSDGKEYSGKSYYLTSRGIILARNERVFTYVPVNNQIQSVPDGWDFTWTQRGDIESTRIITVKRRIDTGAFNVSKPNHEIGFYDIDKKEIVGSIKMSVADHDPVKTFNQRFFLFKTVLGPLSIAVEDGYKNVVVRNIRTGQSKVAFTRDLGIVSMWSRRASSGRVQITAAVGFENKTIFDAEDFLDSGRLTALDI